MFGDDERLRPGQIEHLPGAVADARVRIGGRTAPRAGRFDLGLGVNRCRPWWWWINDSCSLGVRAQCGGWTGAYTWLATTISY